MPFLVSTGPYPSQEIKTASNSLAEEWGGPFSEFDCDQNPRKILNSLREDKGLVHLIGDPGMTLPEGGSWIESLGAWRQPTILMALATQEGKIPGGASAYVALCKFHSVPLLGIVQVGGSWNGSLRRVDNLPWRGWMPNDNSFKLTDVNFSKFDYELNSQEVVYNLQRKLISMKS